MAIEIANWLIQAFVLKIRIREQIERTFLKKFVKILQIESYNKSVMNTCIFSSRKTLKTYEIKKLTPWLLSKQRTPSMSSSNFSKSVSKFLFPKIELNGWASPLNEL